MLLPYLLFILLTPSQEIAFYNTCSDLTVADNSIELEATISGKKHTFKLDFGRVESELSNVETKTYPIATSVFKGDVNFIGIPPKNDCRNRNPNTLGYGLFKKCRHTLVLNFDESTFCCLSAGQANSFIEANEYEEVESAFKKDGLYITFLIRREPFVLKFDTGFTGTISMSHADAEIFAKEPCKTYENQLGKFSIYPNKWVTINDIYYNSTVMVSNIENSKIGMGLIKGFNWVIDFKKQRVFIKKNTVAIDAENQYPSPLETAMINGNLTVISVATKDFTGRLGNYISSVNGVAITPENCCGYENLINSTKDLNKLKIEFAQTE